MYNLIAQTTTNADLSSGVGLFYLLIVLVAVIISIAGLWKMFEKANQPGWASIVPIYNTYVLIKISGRPGWWLLLMIIPLVNIIVSLIVALDIAKRFDQSEVFGIFMLWFFSAIGYVMLGFGEAKYQASKSD